MLYVLTIKKHFNQKGIHPSLQIVRNYIDLYAHDDLLICWPGYLSTNIKTAKTFYNKFTTPLFKGTKNHNNPSFFFKGINGDRNIGGLVPTKTISNYLNYLYNGHFLSYGANDDHSIITAFCNMNNICKPPYGVNMDKLIDDIASGTTTFKTMLIDSSSHSHNTLIKISPDKMGECDIFHFDGDYCNNENGYVALYNRVVESNREVDNQNMSIALTKEVVSSLSLNDIFRHLLEK